MAQNTSVTSIPSPSVPPPSPPPIAALFLVVFDHRKGYVVQWHKSTPDVEVEGVVEFKSLPSGLHHVQQDLVYFVHGQYAGVSAYINQPDATSERNASMLAVGVLVPLENGRMGKSWLHAEHLEDLASKQIKDIKNTHDLDQYWIQHKLNDSSQPILPEESTDTLIPQANGQTNGYHKNRSMSAASVFLPGHHSLALHHPATVLIDMLSLFGPLIFPLYRAALLRKRILLVTEAPVEFACNIVYNLSILSSLPRRLSTYLSRSDPSSRRIRSLFNVGIQDIDLLSEPAKDGWIACTTDDLLATKPELYDIAVHLPSRESKRAQNKVYPKIVPSSPELAKQFPKVGIRASQRDAVRYGGLVEALRAYPKSQVSPASNSQEQQQSTDVAVEGDTDAASTYSSRAPSLHEHRQIVEPPSWSQVAYTSLLWWASAGDRHNSLSEEEDEELERDAMLLDTADVDGDEEGRTKEVVVVGYFRRLTGMMFQAVGDVLRQEDRDEDAIEEDDDDDDDDDDDVDGEEEEEGAADNGSRGADDGEANERQESGKPGHPNEHYREESFDEGSDVRRPLVEAQNGDEVYDGGDDSIYFTPEDVSAMGLDVWSRSDRTFVEELLQTWWGRKARVRWGGVECCGVRIL